MTREEFDARERLVDREEHGLEDRRKLREQAAGMWRDRTDLPDFEALRREFDRDDE